MLMICAHRGGGGWLQSLVAPRESFHVPSISFLLAPWIMTSAAFPQPSLSQVWEMSEDMKISYIFYASADRPAGTRCLPHACIQFRNVRRISFQEVCECECVCKWKAVLQDAGSFQLSTERHRSKTHVF